MMTFALPRLAFATCWIVGSASAGPVAADDRDAKAVAFATALDGDWRGSLEYRDYQTNKRVTLPTTLEARPAEEGRSVGLKFVYDEGKGRFAKGMSTLRVDSRKNTLVWESEKGSSGAKVQTEYALTGLDAFAEKRQGELILTGLDTENGQEVETRQTITLVGDDLTILRESRKPGDSFAFRNTYKFKRTPPPPPPAVKPPTP